VRIRSTQIASVRSSLHADWSVEAPRSASLARFPRLLARAEPTTSSVTCVKAYTGERLCAYGSAYELKILVVSRHSLIRRSRSLHRRMSYLGDRIWQQYLRMRYTVTQLLPASMPERTHKLEGQSYADSWQAHVPCRSSYPGRHSARLAFFAKRPTFDAPCTPALAPKPIYTKPRLPCWRVGPCACGRRPSPVLANAIQEQRVSPALVVVTATGTATVN